MVDKAIVTSTGATPRMLGSTVALRPIRRVETSVRLDTTAIDAYLTNSDGQETAMADISVAQAKARLSELLERAASGEIVTVSRRGKPVARIVGAEAEPKSIDLDELRRLTASMPPATGSAGEFVRRMRDEDRF